MIYAHPGSKLKLLLVLVILIGFHIACLGQKIYTPSSTSTLTGTSNYCLNATATALIYTYNSCNTGSGTATGTSVTVNWYSNTINSSAGGTLVSSAAAISTASANGNTSFVPPTSIVGTLYYYCEIVWSGAGTCNLIGKLTSTTKIVTIAPIPDVITGNTTACLGTAMSLSNAVAGGTWTSSSNPIATISSDGVATAVAIGTATISYTIGLCRSTIPFTAIANPNAITSSTVNVCTGSSVIYSNTTTGGNWTTGNGSIASIDGASPVNVTGMTVGTTNITYTLPTGCIATKPITVNVTPGPITGIAAACVGYQTSLYNSTPGGVWSSDATVRATIDASTGVAFGVAFGGTANIAYTVGTCKSTVIFAINTNPANIAGTNSVCQGSVTTLSDATSLGAWSISNVSIATVNSSTATGVTGITAGNATITYTGANGCYITRPFTVNIAPGANYGTFRTVLRHNGHIGKYCRGRHMDKCNRVSRYHRFCNRICKYTE